MEVDIDGLLVESWRNGKDECEKVPKSYSNKR
jgi:hypothetical protein